jgi:hypothetical protein
MSKLMLFHGQYSVVKGDKKPEKPRQYLYKKKNVILFISLQFRF